ncbi:YbbR-like domain-containing protein [Lacrimispora sphenoides]|uniref:YbbR domain-containing protein n=1 Tax=Lacrimispora sphenoides JCM 1415 TaxID=1297793 RepID=A0ABY1C342_9FIRM|nr:CdaR family protein [Lacrimispora sphenoides]SET59194.1 YbbR domain-containing protein [[Clostridium] sphenoides JCM 1415]SUY49942.1 YbbR-like protein [Lacrimispora sphenoides]
MKEKLLNNLGLKVASLVLAFAVWMAVVNISNPIIDDSQIVTVEVLNEDVLEASNLTYEIVGKDSVTISYQVRTRDRSLLRASDFHAYVDLKDYNVTGAIPITVEINKDKENLVKSDAITAKPMVIRIRTEELQRKKFDLQVQTKGNQEDGYELGMITLSPDYVTVEGPESQIGQINHMGIEIDVDNANADIKGVANPVFYDANGNKMPELENKVTVNRHEIEYTVSVLKAKNLTINFEVSGEVAKGYRYTGLESNFKSVPVVGTNSLLASLTSLSVSSDKLNIDGATSDKVVQLDLSQYLPPNTSIAGEEYKNVTVKLKVEPLTTRVFTLKLKNLDKKGAEADYDYSFDKETSDVTVKGLKADLDALTETNLNAVLDVTDQEAGPHAGMVTFEVSGGLEVVGYTPFNVTVTHKNPGPGTDESTTATSAEVPESQ